VNTNTISVHMVKLGGFRALRVVFRGFAVLKATITTVFTLRWSF
jgi:hypothetical protein